MEKKTRKTASFYPKKNTLLDSNKINVILYPTLFIWDFSNGEPCVLVIGKNEVLLWKISLLIIFSFSSQLNKQQVTIFQYGPTSKSICSLGPYQFRSLIWPVFFSKEYKMLNIRKITMDVDLYVGNVIIFEKINFEKPRESLSICWFKN